LQGFFDISFMPSKKVVILGTGGPIAGIAKNSSSNTDYTAAQLGVSDLVRTIAELEQEGEIETEQLAQIDNKDMSFKAWTALANRVEHRLAQSDVPGVVIAHGTDTLEETAYFLQADRLHRGK
jgi:L-asparaginase